MQNMFTALMIACQEGKKQVVIKLLEGGANADMRDSVSYETTV